MRLLSITAALAGVAALAGPVFASTTATWELSTYADFLKGRISGLSLSRDGRLMLAPRLETVLSSDQPQVWTLASGPNGLVYAGTGHCGRVYEIDPKGRSSVVWTAGEPEVFALAANSRGVLYAGTSPDGKVYQISNGKAAEFFSPGTKYIWALALAPDGSLFVGTGDQGKIYRVTPDGKGSVYYESGQAHITCLAFDREGRLLAGSEPNGILYRVTAPGKAFVLYDANLPEIRGIATTADGTIYVAALGGSISKRTASSTGTSTSTGGTVVTAPTTTITVTDTANAQSDFKTPKPEAPKAATAPQTAVSTAITATGSASAFELAGVDKSAIYRIAPDNTVETVWSSKDENAYDLGLSGSEIVFVTDTQGRLYRLDQDRKPTLVTQTGEGEATRILSSPQGLMVATGDLGKVYRLVAERTAHGSFESPVHDANTVARWGRLSWRAQIPSGAALVFRTRSGNSGRPDNTWSDWSAPLADSQSAAIPSPNARYLQWRVDVSTGNDATPVLESVTAAYLPQNTPPVVRSITVNLQPPGAQKPTAQAAANSGAFSITVTDTGDTSATPTSTGTPTQTISRGPNSQVQVVWQAEDPDGDRLVYGLYFRGEDEREWKLIRGNLTENSFLLDTDVLADGRYLFRVVASDRPSNPVGTARDAELTSSPILIDNTPPVVTAREPRRDGSKLEIDVGAADATSSLRRCEYSVDAGPWTPLEAEDGVTDSPHERFLLRLDDVRPGEHVVVFRVYDSANNAGLTKVVVR
jgi:sugar lactone lactonase YvrE